MRREEEAQVEVVVWRAVATVLRVANSDANQIQNVRFLPSLMTRTRM